jgi:hypothetical protein
MQEQALGQTQKLASNDPTTNAATNLSTSTLNGNYLNSNPYLNQTFNQAADQTQNRLSSEFAGAGSNVQNSAPVRSDELNNLATGIYGQNYQDERNRQQQTLGMAPQTQGLGYNDINALFSGGQQVQQLGQQYANAPSQWLQQYLQQVSPGLGQQSTTPQFYNQGAGALGGALAGSSLFSGSGLPSWLGGLIGGYMGA